MTTTRRKSTAAADKASDTPADEQASAPADTTPAAAEPEPTAVPSATPLEPPAAAPTVEPEPDNLVKIADFLPEDIGGLIVDAETRQPPTDLDAVFTKATVHGTDGICTLRLLQHSRASRHSRPMTTLLVAQGAQLSGENVSRIMAELRAQAEARAAAAAVDAE